MPQSKGKNNPFMKSAYILFLFFSFLLFALIISAPYLEYWGYDKAASFSHILFSNYCHQRAERSFFIWGNQMPVCARDFGIYFGLLIGTLLYPVTGKTDKIPPGWIILAASFPLLVDGGTQLLGMRESTNTLRYSTGFLFGLIIPYYLIPIGEVVVDYVKGIFIRNDR